MGADVLTDERIERTLEHMPLEMRTMFDTLPVDFQEAYLAFWDTRPDAHAAHRDTLPSFMAGLFAGLRR